MDLLAALRNTIAPEREVRDEAERILASAAGSHGFGSSLLQLVMSPEADPAVRQAGAVYFKNYVYRHWEKRESMRDTFFVGEEEKLAIRGAMLDSMVHSPDLIRAQLALAFRRMVTEEYPTRDQEFCAKLLAFLQTQDIRAVSGGLLAVYQIAIKFEFLTREDRVDFDNMIAALQPYMYQLLLTLYKTPNPDALTVMRQVLKIYYRAVDFELSPGLAVPEVFGQWMNAFLSILSMPVETPSTDDKEDWPQRPVWKAKKWIARILFQVFERYGMPTKATENMRPFAAFYMDTWSVPILKVVLDVLFSSSRGVYQSPRVVQQSLRFVSTAIEHSKTWLEIKPVFMDLVQAVIFPLLCQSDEDEELWEADPYEYVRVKFDPAEDFVNPVQAASNLFQELCSTRAKQTFDSIVAFCYNILQRELTAPPEARQPRHKDGVLHMVGLIGDQLHKKKRYRGNLEQLLVTFVLPEFASPHGYLRARACFVLHTFADIDFQNPQTLVAATQSVLNGLRDPALPVRVEAGVALRYLLRQQTAVEVVRPHIQAIIETLLMLLRESENDDLTSVLGDLIDIFGDGLLPFAAGLAEHLAVSFVGMLDYDPNEESETNRAMAAMGILSTLQTLLATFSSHRDVQQHLELSIMRVLSAILEHGHLDFIEESLEIIAACTSEGVSPAMWSALAMMHAAFKRDSIDFFNEMVSPIYNFIRKGSQVLTDPTQQYLPMVFEMCKAVWERDQSEDSQWHAGKVMELLLLCCMGQMDQYMPAFVGLAVTRLLRDGDGSQAIKTDVLRQMAMNLVIAGLFYNPLALLTTLQNTHSEGGETLLSRFMALWFSSIDSFKGLHARKLGILALSRLLEVPYAQLPGHAQQGWTHILPVVVRLCSGLQKAYAYRDEMEAELESDDEEGQGGEDEDDEEDLPENALEDDEDADENDYSEIIASYSSELQSIGGPREDDDNFEEGQFTTYRTPIDEHESDGLETVEFHRVLTELEHRDPSAYALLLSGLTPELQAALTAIRQQAVQLQMAKQSKEVAAQGGYNFGECSLPSTFNFVAK
eukprot:m.228397 g.228397  ORF g.228397 m.228397 type:complete len:1049 (+) comp11736_c0_seq1:40-3186(+)